MAELEYKWWKKNKPLTLRGEPLSEQLKQIEKAQTDLEKLGSYKDAMFLHLRLPAVKAAIEESIKKCNKTLHKSAIKDLADLRIKADFYHKIIVAQMGRTEKALNAIRAKHKEAVDAGIHAVGQPTEANLKKVVTATTQLNKLTNDCPYVLDIFNKVSLYGFSGIGAYSEKMIELLQEKKSGKNVDTKFEQCKRDLTTKVKEFAAIKII